MKPKFKVGDVVRAKDPSFCISGTIRWDDGRLFYVMDSDYFFASELILVRRGKKAKK